VSVGGIDRDLLAHKSVESRSNQPP
jgi:hypothetical protein